MSLNLNNAVQIAIEKSNAKNHRWSEAQMEDYKNYLLNDPTIQSILDDVLHEEDSFVSFLDLCENSYKRWVKSKAVIGNHMHNYSMDYSDWETPIKEKWLSIKSDNSSTIVLIHIGKFYEAYHQDADILHKILGAPYTYGYVAHNGFPVSKFDKYRIKLKEHGYNSIRIISV